MKELNIIETKLVSAGEITDYIVLGAPVASFIVGMCQGNLPLTLIVNSAIFATFFCTNKHPRPSEAFIVGCFTGIALGLGYYDMGKSSANYLANNLSSLF